MWERYIKNIKKEKVKLKSKANPISESQTRWSPHRSPCKDRAQGPSLGRRVCLHGKRLHSQKWLIGPFKWYGHSLIFGNKWQGANQNLLSRRGEECRDANVHSVGLRATAPSPQWARGPRRPEALCRSGVPCPRGEPRDQPACSAGCSMPRALGALAGPGGVNSGARRPSPWSVLFFPSQGYYRTEGRCWQWSQMNTMGSDH